MASFIPIAQGFKIAAGLAQVTFGLWVVIRSPRTRTNVAFAVAFGANGIAFAIWNLARPGLRTPHSLATQGRGVFNWIATLAMILFAVFFLQILQRSRPRLLILPVSIALAMLASDVSVARAYRLDLLAFGGLAIYPATAFALAINSVDHIGAYVVRPSPYSPADVAVQLAGMLIILLAQGGSKCLLMQPRAAAPTSTRVCGGSYRAISIP